VPADDLKSTLGDAALYFAARSLPVVVQLAVGLALLQFAGPKPYVTYTLNLGLILALATVASAWLAQGLIRHQDLLSDNSQTFAVMVMGSAVTLVVTLPLVWLAVTVLLDNSGVGMAAVTGLYTSTFLYLVKLHATIGRSKPFVALITECCRSCILVVGGAAVIAATGDQQAERMLWISAASFMAATFVGSPPRPTSIDWWAARRSLGTVFRSDGLACAWVIFALALFLVDRLALADTVSPTVLAAYIFTADVTQRAAQFLISPLGLVLQPRMATATKANGIGAGYATVRNALVFQLMGTMMFGAIGAVLGSFLLEFALGPSATHAQGVLFPLMAAALLWQTATLWQKPLEFAGLLSLTTLGVACAASLQTGAVLIFGATFGIAVAAWGLLATVTLYAAGLLIIASRTIGKTQT
jgi:O-antigen/teichoic acid export membrane protein